jgi:excisionase family DNA binding protein
MDKKDAVTFDNMPEAITHLLHEVAYIKNYLLNKSTSTSEPVIVPPVDKAFLTVKEVSQMIRKSKGTVYNMTSARKIPFIKNGNRVVFDRQEILNWMREDERKTAKQLQEEIEAGFRNQ